MLTPHTPKEDLLIRLRRIEGQVRGITRMVEQDKHCIDILTQVCAVNRALQCVALAELDDHITQCLIHAARTGGEDQEAKITEASAAIARLVRSQPSRDVTLTRCCHRRRIDAPA